MSRPCALLCRAGSSIHDEFSLVTTLRPMKPMVLLAVQALFAALGLRQLFRNVFPETRRLAHPQLIVDVWGPLVVIGPLLLVLHGRRIGLAVARLRISGLAVAALRVAALAIAGFAVAGFAVTALTVARLTVARLTIAGFAVARFRIAGFAVSALGFAAF